MQGVVSTVHIPGSLGPSLLEQCNWFKHFDGLTASRTDKLTKLYFKK